MNLNQLKNNKILIMAWICNILTFLMYSMMAANPVTGFKINILVSSSYIIYGYISKQYSFIIFNIYYIFISIVGICNLSQNFVMKGNL